MVIEFVCILRMGLINDLEREFRVTLIYVIGSARVKVLVTMFPLCFDVELVDK